MKKLDIFEPAMCCETGVCGVDPDTLLITFSADIEWLRKQDVAVQRFNLAQEPAAFINDPVVKAEINEQGEDCLPLIFLDGTVVSRGKYPGRAELQTLLNITEPLDMGLDSEPAGQSSCCATSSDCC